MTRKVRHFLEYLFLRVVVSFFNTLPESAVRRIAAAAGVLWFHIDRGHREIARRNIGYAFPEMAPEERDRILKESYKNTVETFITFPRIARFDEAYVRKRFTFVDEENFLEARGRGKGVFFLTGHSCNWEYAAAAHSIRNGGLMAVAKDIHNPYIDAYIKTWRTNAGVELIRPRNAVFRIMKSLKKGKTIAMLLDQNTLRHEAVFVSFFGRPAATQYAMALIALKTGAAVVPSYVTRDKEGGGFIIKYEKPMYVTDEGDKEQAVVKWTQVFTSFLEDHIRSAPEEWFWVHNRFKTTPGP